MPILDRTQLNSSDKLHLLAKSSVCQAYGDISQLSTEFNVSRKVIYKSKKDAHDILSAALTPAGNSKQINVDTQQLKRTIVALSIAGVNFIRSIENMIPIIYPGVTCSFGSIQALQIEAQTNAQAFNRTVELNTIDSGAIDEVFCQGEPVLAGIDLDSGYVFSLAHELYRDGDTWANTLNKAKSQGLDLKHIVKDGATGMAKGVKEVFPSVEQRDDAFHALYITTKSLGKVEKRAYRHIEQEHKLMRDIEKAKGDEKATLVAELCLVSEACRKAVSRYDFAQAGYRYLQRALNSVHQNTHFHLMSPKMAQTLLKLSVRNLKKSRHRDCSNAARYIKNRLRGLTLATADFYQKQQALSQDYSPELVALACYFFEYKRSLKKISAKKLPVVHTCMIGAYHYLRQALGDNESHTLMKKVEKLLDKRHRASSAIEGFNALLRPYMYVRKGVSQGFLELFQAWHNLRIRRNGKHQGTSALGVLTGKPVGDWLTILGYPPSSITH
ncbi:MAG: transposase [Colwellia sp.]|nr:transposase [Colwellia sp.]